MMERRRHLELNAALKWSPPFFSLLMIGLAAAALLDLKPSGRVAALKPISADCEGWDRDAVEGLIPFMYQGSAAAELKLNEGLAQLRRARAYCKDGFVPVARSDYAALHRSFPVMTGSIGSPAATTPAASDRPVIKVKN